MLSLAAALLLTVCQLLADALLRTIWKTSTFHGSAPVVNECDLNPCLDGEHCDDPDTGVRLDYRCTNTSGKCPAGFSHQVHGQCFKIVNLASAGVERTWNGARDYCATLTPGGDLASIHDEMEARMAFALFKKIGRKSFWLGIHDNLVEGEFINLDGTALESESVDRWRWDKPSNDATKNCAYVNGNSLVGSWADMSCLGNLKHALCGVPITLPRSLPAEQATGGSGGVGGGSPSPSLDSELQLYECHGGSIDCPDDVLAIDVTPSLAPAMTGLVPSAFVLADVHGSVARITVPGDVASAFQTTATGKANTLLLPLGADSVESDANFDWARVDTAGVVLQGPGPQSQEELDQLGTLDVANIRLGAPLRRGHVSSPDDFVLDDLACDPVSGWFEVSPFVQHWPARYSHCRQCCCFFDDPRDPETRFCYEQGDVIADVNPGSDLAPNDQCAVCNRQVNPDVMTPRNLLLPPFVDPPFFTCDDLESCTYGDRCTDEGACVGTLYLTCLNNDVIGVPDPARNCEVCDGSGPASPTLGCTAKPGHYV